MTGESGRNNFLVTGFGRSGTEFLSRIMDRSEIWSVPHEPREGFDSEEFFKGAWIPEQILRDFDRDYYGEVNSRLRFYLFRLPVKKAGIIARDPKEIFLSVMNRKKYHKIYKEMIDSILFSLNIFADYSNKFSPLIIDFEKMVSDKEYLERTLRWFGIEDVSVSEEDLKKKVNKNKRIKFDSFDDLPRKIRREFESRNWEVLMEKIQDGPPGEAKGGHDT